MGQTVRYSCVFCGLSQSTIIQIPHSSERLLLSLRLAAHPSQGLIGDGYPRIDHVRGLSRSPFMLLSQPISCWPSLQNRRCPRSPLSHFQLRYWLLLPFSSAIHRRRNDKLARTHFLQSHVYWWCWSDSRPHTLTYICAEAFTPLAPSFEDICLWDWLPERLCIPHDGSTIGCRSSRRKTLHAQRVYAWHSEFRL